MKVVHRKFTDLTELLQPRPDLILLDEWLGTMPGHEICKSLKSGADSRHIPVLLFSAVDRLQQIAQDCGADGFIEKPFDLNSLISGVRTALDKTI